MKEHKSQKITKLVYMWINMGWWKWLLDLKLKIPILWNTPHQGKPKKRCYKNISVTPKSLTRTKDEHDGKCKEEQFFFPFDQQTINVESWQVGFLAITIRSNMQID